MPLRLHLGLGGMPVPSQAQVQSQWHHHLKLAGSKSRHIDFPAAGGEVHVLLTMRAAAPTHFNIYLLNHHHARRHRQHQGYLSGPAFDGGGGNDGDALTSHLRQQEQEQQSDSAASRSPTASRAKNGGNFDFLSSGFQGLPKSVDTQQKQQQQRQQQAQQLSTLPYAGSYGSSSKQQAVVEELFVPEGRQNVFVAILFYLITSQAASSSASSSSSTSSSGSSSGRQGQQLGGQLEGALRDLALEVFGAARVPGHVQLPQ